MWLAGRNTPPTRRRPMRSSSIPPTTAEPAIVKLRTEITPEAIVRVTSKRSMIGVMKVPKRYCRLLQQIITSAPLMAVIQA